MFRLFEKCQSFSFVQKNSQQEIDVKTILDVHKMYKEVKQLLENYPSDDPLRQDYDKLPREECSMNPTKFYQFKEDLEMIFKELLKRQKLDSFPVSKVSP